MNTLTPEAAEIPRWAADDYVELFLVRDVVRRVIGPPGRAQEKEAALSALWELLDADLVRVGDMRADTPGWPTGS